MPREDPKAAARQARLLAKTNEVQGHAHMILHGEERLRAGAMLKLADLSADPAKQRGVVKDGGLTIKRNDWRNGFGALGEVFLILGRFNLAPIAEQPQ